jgi:hypothetical protein
MRYVMLALLFMGCDGSPEPDGDAGGGADAGPVGDAGAGECTLTANTAETSTVSPAGCVVLDRDTSSCESGRAGLDGFWLDFSCRVTLTANGATIRAVADGLPDHRSNYFQADDPCHEDYPEGTQNPNFIGEQSYTIDFPSAPSTTATPMTGAVVGLAADGVPIFANFAAPGDDIYLEALTFDRCGGHPQRTGMYHYHSEPYALSYDDDRFIGVMRDGYPIYGRRDPDGSLPTLDAQGGHTSATMHSTTPVYHYHVNEQTSTSPGTEGQMQWFLTTGTYHGAPGACTGCN